MFAMGGNGRSRFIIPIIIVVWFGIMFTLMFWPMTHMQMEGLSFGIISFDEGAQTPAGEMNVGDTLVESLTSGSDESSDDEDEDSTSNMIAWTQLNSEEELEESIGNVEYYGVLVVPEDYTAATMAAQAASSGATGTAQSGVDESQLEALAAQSGMDVSQLQAIIAQAGEGDMDEAQLQALAAQSGMDVSQLQALIAQAGTGETQAGTDASQLQGGGIELSDENIAALQASGVDVSTILDENGELTDDGIAALQASGMDVSAILGEDVTAQQSAAGDDQSASTEVEEATDAPTLTMLIDNAKSPMVANMLRTSIASMFTEMGADVDVQVIHNGQDESEASDDTNGSGFTMASMYGTMMGQQLGIMPVCMITMISSMMIARAFRRKDAKTKGGSWSAMLRQVLYALCLSFLISILALIMVRGVAGVEIPLVTGGLFLWIAAFCMMLLYLALNNIALWLGLIGGFCVSMLGMMTGIFPAEMLPPFWQDFIYPWTPQHFVGGGLRLIEYVDGGVWNANTMPLIVYGIVGVVLMIIVGLIPTKAQREHNLEVQGETNGAMETESVTDRAQDEVTSVADRAQEEANNAAQKGRDAAERGKGRHEA